MSLESRCPLNRGWAGVLLKINQQRQYKQITIYISLRRYNYAKFTQEQNIDLSKIVKFVKAAIIVISQVLSAVMSPEWSS